MCLYSSQKSTFASLSEVCYTAQKTYRLVLSKYVISLRQAHTQDMVRDIRLYPNSEPHSHSLSLPAAQITLVRRVIEHMLSLYSYCNFSAQVITLYVISCTLHYFITPAHFITKYGLTLYGFCIRIWMDTCDSLCCCSALNGPVVNSLFSLIRC